MQINPHTPEAYKLLLDGAQTLCRMSQAGMHVDVEYVRYKKDQLITRMNRLEADFKQTNFFKHWQHTTNKTVNIDSDDQLAYFLYTVKKIKPPKLTPSGKGSTDEETLIQLDIPELNILLERARFKKPWDVLNGFEQEQVNGVIHPFFNLHLVKTFRSSSNNPNMQNVPARDEEVMRICRRALFPRPGHQLVEIDFKKIEVGVAACYNKDANLIRYLKNPASDMHADMAQQIFVLDKSDKNISDYDVLRQAAKNGFVFPEFYGDYYKNCAYNTVCHWGNLSKGRWSPGQGINIGATKSPFHLADHLISKGLRSFDTFTNHMKAIEQDFWGNRFPEYTEWKDRWWRAYCKHGYIDLLTGFRCSGVMDRKECINYPVQGAAFHCLLFTLNELDRVMRKEHWDTQIIGQIHDSGILDTTISELPHVIETARYIATEMLSAAWQWICIPMDIDVEICDVDKSWADARKYKTAA